MMKKYGDRLSDFLVEILSETALKVLPDPMYKVFWLNIRLLVIY